MKHSISSKLALAFILVAVLTATLLTLVFFSSTTNRFQQYVFDQQFYAKLAEVESFYSTYKSWEGVEELLTTQTGAMHGPGGSGRGNQGQGGAGGQGQGQGAGGMRQTEQAASEVSPTPLSPMGSRQYALADQDGLVLVGIEGLYPQGTKLSHEQLNEGVPVHDGTKHVGTLLAQKRNIVYTQAEQHFLDRTGKGLLWALLITVILAALFGFLLSRSLTRPVVELTKAAQNLAGGALGETVDVRSSDELGELSTVFNKMSAELEQSDRMRKQMTADIAHDLRTPLTVIGGYIESMRDGDLEPTPERLSLIYSEILRLNRLVDDLRFLSQSDSGNLPMNVAPLDANELLEQSREIFKLKVQEKDLSLELDLQENLPLIVGDESRLMQVLENLVGNAIRHSQQGGTIRLSTRLVDTEPGKQACVKFTVADNGEGIPAESQPYVFKRFHRADKSRHADESQSGLGLAIVKAIVLAHGGEVWVESEVGKGSSFHFCIPTQG